MNCITGGGNAKRKIERFPFSCVNTGMTKHRGGKIMVGAYLDPHIKDMLFKAAWRQRMNLTEFIEWIALKYGGDAEDVEPINQKPGPKPKNPPSSFIPPFIPEPENSEQTGENPPDDAK
jgi:hypothetical protein